MVDISDLKQSESEKTLWEATRQARTTSSTPGPAAITALEEIGRASRLNGSIGLIEQVLAMESNRQLLLAYQNPLADLRRAGVLEASFRSEPSRILEWLDEYENRFTTPTVHTLNKLTSTLGIASELRRAAESMEHPWFEVEDVHGSLHRLAGLQTIGHLLGNVSTFQPSTADRLRESLGDWREIITWPEKIWTDLGIRDDFY